MISKVYRSLAELPECYSALFEEAGRRSFFSSRGWFETLSETALEPGDSLRLYGVEDEGRALGLLPMRSPAGQNGSVLAGRSLGPRSLASLTNFQTCEFEPLLAAAAPKPDAVLAKAIGHMAAERPRWSVIDINGLEERSGWVARLSEAFRAAGLRARSYFYVGKIYEQLDAGGFDAFLTTRRKGSPFREYRRKARRLDREGRRSFRIYRGREALSDGLAAYRRVRAESWKEPDYFPEFLDRLLREAAASEALRLGVLLIDGEPAAADAWLLHDERATAYRGCYSERFKRLSPGGISLFEMFRRVLDEEAPREVDFGRDEEAYKLRWLYSRRELWGLTAFQSGNLWGQLAHADDGVRRAVGALKRRLRGRASES